MQTQTVRIHVDSDTSHRISELRAFMAQNGKDSTLSHLVSHLVEQAHGMTFNHIKAPAASVSENFER